MKKDYSNGYKSIHRVHLGRGNNKKLEPEDVLTIRRMKDKLTIKEMADFYEVTPMSIRNVLNGLTWKNLKEEK